MILRLPVDYHQDGDDWQQPLVLDGGGHHNARYDGHCHTGSTQSPFHHRLGGLLVPVLIDDDDDDDESDNKMA